MKSERSAVTLNFIIFIISLIVYVQLQVVSVLNELISNAICWLNFIPSCFWMIIWFSFLSFKIGYEFDFKREADAMERIRHFLHENNKNSPVMVPRVIRNMVTRRVLVMEYIDGIPILKLGDEIAKRGINPGGKIAAVAKRNILKSLAVAYGQMILKSGFFHADPHPGNILICKGSEVALLDYGQVKDLPDNLRLGCANLVIAIADKDLVRASESYKELGIHTLIKCEDGQQEMLKLAQTMFDTKLQPGVKMLQPFFEESSIKKIAVQAFPEELFSVLLAWCIF
ncbi:hypothetical protein ACSBR2_023157 [Camellia fascicularis]